MENMESILTAAEGKVIKRILLSRDGECIKIELKGGQIIEINLVSGGHGDCYALMECELIQREAV